MNEYKSLEIRIIHFSTEDVICTSNLGTDEQQADGTWWY